MDKLAIRVLKEEVAPQLKKMLDSGYGITSLEFEYIKDCICVAKELLECDVLLMKLGQPDPEMSNPKDMSKHDNY